jgi:type IV pilus assembly protein PilB
MYPGAERMIEVHVRVEGRLQPWSCDDELPADAFMATVRSQAGMPSKADRTGPADGYLQRRIDDAPVRFRVSVLPMTTANGTSRAESIVIRIQDSRNLPGNLGQLGLENATREKLDRALAKSQGMIVLTGPAGSGRTTTMAAALHSVVQPELSTISIEDPVDYVRDGVRHVQIDRTLELEAALRAVLRHDPDVVLVGEIRDRVSADLAVKLANTGQLVFSLLQTADTVSAVGALLRMGVEPFLVAYAVNLIVAQRLVREVCPKCSVPDNKRDPVLMRRLGFTDEEILSESILRANPGTKCSHCAGRGYRGRRVVSEALYFSTPIRHLITESGEDIEEAALLDLGLEEGMSTLASSCRRLVLDGVTTVEELMRIHV